MQVGLVELIRGVAGSDPLLGGLVIAAMNRFGASLILVWRDPSERALDGTLGFAAGVMLAVGIQNVPEGMAASVAAANAGLDRRLYAVFSGIRSGLVELPLAVLDAVAVVAVEPLLPYAMGFAAGAVLFVSDEIVPETHTRGNERPATLGLMAETVVMLYLDVSLG